MHFSQLSLLATSFFAFNVIAMPQFGAGPAFQPTQAQPKNVPSLSVTGPLGSFSNGPNGVAASNPFLGTVANGPTGAAASNPFLGSVSNGPNGVTASNPLGGSISLNPPAPKPAGKGWA